ncbi:MAG: Arc family DNA-binding protein [Gemmatimonadota bacterium]|nr:Arc family DNA-binding protein [Gemmatimonadota bacterium]
MASLTIKNVPQSLYERLKQSAEEGHRSLNSEVIHRLEQAVGAAPVNAVLLLDRARAVRERARLPYLTDDALRRDRERGRE